MLVQPGLCQTWSEPQIVGFLTHRLIYEDKQELQPAQAGVHLGTTVTPSKTHIIVFWLVVVIAVAFVVVVGVYCYCSAVVVFVIFVLQ